MSGKTLGRVGYETTVSRVRQGDDEYAAWDEIDEIAEPGSLAMLRADWEAQAQAVAAHAAGTTAEDDGAAEITRVQAELENQVARGDRLEGKCEDIAAAADQLRERVARAAASLDADALATAPSKKSQIQEDAARRIREAIG